MNRDGLSIAEAIFFRRPAARRALSLITMDGYGKKTSPADAGIGIGRRRREKVARDLTTAGRANGPRRAVARRPRAFFLIREPETMGVTAIAISKTGGRKPIITRLSKSESPLLSLIEIIKLQEETIQVLKDEIARLKGTNQKPKVPPSNLGKMKKKKVKDKDGKRDG